MLPQLNCHIEYHNSFISKTEARLLYDEISNDYRIAELNKKIMQGEVFISENGKLMFIDQELYDSGTFPEEQWGETAVWSKRMLGIKQQVEALTGKQFEVCVCIYYPNGHTGVSYHSDYNAFGDTSFIPSLSIGEERRFLLREKSSQQEHEFLLEEGSLFIMGEHCQERYEHCLPIDPKYKNGRINLTFRQYDFKN